MSAPQASAVNRVGEQVDELLDALRAGKGDPAATADELVRLLVGLYGDGLARIVGAMAEHGEAGAAILAGLTNDPLVESLLLLHDLHPLDVDTRVQRALDQVRPYLGSHAGGVEYLGVTDGVAKLRLEGSCHGCPSSTVTVRLAIEGAVMNAAPEVSEVIVEGMTKPPEPALLQIGRRPEPAGDGWVTLPNIGPPSSRPVIVSAAGTPVLVCAVRGTLYAYRDACAVCGSSLADGALEREQLSCPRCGTRFNVRLAGQGIDDTALRLDPLPLLTDSLGVRVALPEIEQSKIEYSQVEYSQVGYSQAGHSHVGHSHVGHSQTGYSQTGYSETGYSQTGYSETGYSS
jgi:Fe-S cluster biogenesis protein NfuA